MMNWPHQNCYQYFYLKNTLKFEFVWVVVVVVGGGGGGGGGGLKSF